MRTRSAGRPSAESLGGGTGERVSRCGKGRRPREGNDEHVVSNQGNVGSQNGNVVNENVSGECWECDSEWQLVSYEMQKLESELWNHAMVGAGHAAYTDRFHELARLVPHLKTPESRMIERNGRDNNKRTRTVNAFATSMNPVGIENTGTWPKCTTCNSYHAPGGPCRTCYNCNRPGHLAKDCRSVPRNVNSTNARNPPVRTCYECGSTDHGRGNQRNETRGRAFMLGAEEARQDPNINTGMFTLNKHFATTLFDSSADYSFVSTTSIPLLGLEPSDLGFKYEIEIASG
ncbi:reverse transcriptase domain-containing protein [Tanacetum coccineum]